MFLRYGGNFLKSTLISKSTLRQFSTPFNQKDILSTNLEIRDITKDRTQEIPVETSIKYLSSEAYKVAYGDQPVWIPYRRNHKGSIPPRKTRKTCIRHGQIDTGSPCPICRDEYLVLHENNIDLLKQFICPHTGNILSYSKTGLCQKQHKLLLVVIERAKDRGLLLYDVHFREYDYSLYLPKVNQN